MSSGNGNLNKDYSNENSVNEKPLHSGVNIENDGKNTEKVILKEVDDIG